MTKDAAMTLDADHGFQGISPARLADDLDDRGVVRLRNVLSDAWLTAMRESVAEHIAANGDGDFYVARADRESDSPAHRLVTDPAVHRLITETARLRRPDAGDDRIRCSMLVRNGFALKARTHMFHFDPNVLTMVVPVFIPDAEFGSCGELAAFGNARPYRRFAATDFVEKALKQNGVYRRRITRRVHRDPSRHVVPLEPGDAYLFWGYRTFHGNLSCAPGLLRTTLVLQYGQVHPADGWVMRTAWQLGRSRRYLHRFEFRAPAQTGSAVASPLRASEIGALRALGDHRVDALHHVR
jgi:hypothetical protein